MKGIDPEETESNNLGNIERLRKAGALCPLDLNHLGVVNHYFNGAEVESIQGTQNSLHNFRFIRSGNQAMNLRGRIDKGFSSHNSIVYNVY